MGCEATRSARERPMLVGQTWECDGTNLVLLVDATASLPPSVVRADLVPYLDDAWSGFLPARPFTGGDHVHAHIHLPIRLPREGVSE